MSTHNIGVYDKQTKLSVNYHQISSNTFSLLLGPALIVVIYKTVI